MVWLQKGRVPILVCFLSHSNSDPSMHEFYINSIFAAGMLVSDQNLGCWHWKRVSVLASPVLPGCVLEFFWFPRSELLPFPFLGYLCIFLCYQLVDQVGGEGPRSPQASKHACLSSSSPEMCLEAVSSNADSQSNHLVKNWNQLSRALF